MVRKGLAMAADAKKAATPDVNLPTDGAVRNRIQRFIEDRFLAGSGQDAVLPDASLLDSGIMDSTGVLELIDFLESTFHIHIADEELVPANLESVDKVVAFVDRKTAPSGE